MLKGIDSLGTIGILLKAIQELKGELEELKKQVIRNPSDSHHQGFSFIQSSTTVDTFRSTNVNGGASMIPRIDGIDLTTGFAGLTDGTLQHVTWA